MIETPFPPLEPNQIKYLHYLRDGALDDFVLVLRDEVTEEARDDFANFRRFMNDHGHPDPEGRDLYLTVAKEKVLSILQYCETNHCLGLRYCFGFNRLVTDGGQLQLINRATIWKRNDDVSDAEIYWSDFKRSDANGTLQPERFLNLDRDQPLPNEQALKYIDNFEKVYPSPLPKGAFILGGSLLPVRVLQAVFTDQRNPLGQAETLTFRFGLTRYEPNESPGNFTLVIGIGDVSTGPMILFRTPENGILGGSLGDCPPRPPCKS